MRNAVLLGLVLISLLLFGCTSSEVKKVESTPTPAAATAGAVQTTPTTHATATPTPEVKTVKIAEVGESLTNDKLKITLNSVDFMDTIPNENEVLTTKAKEGKTFVAVDVSVENIDDKADSVSSVIQFKVKDDAGYSYSFDFLATTNLGNTPDGTLQPGDKVRGKLAFEVPKDAKGLQLVFDFGLGDYAQAKFNLGNAK